MIIRNIRRVRSSLPACGGWEEGLGMSLQCPHSRGETERERFFTLGFCEARVSLQSSRPIEAWFSHGIYRSSSSPAYNIQLLDITCLLRKRGFALLWFLDRVDITFVSNFPYLCSVVVPVSPLVVSYPHGMNNTPHSYSVYT